MDSQLRSRLSASVPESSAENTRESSRPLLEYFPATAARHDRRSKAELRLISRPAALPPQPAPQPAENFALPSEPETQWPTPRSPARSQTRCHRPQSNLQCGRAKRYLPARCPADSRETM